MDYLQTADDLTVISTDEQRRAERFFQDVHRKRYLAARVALRRLLSTKTGQSAGALTFSFGHSGKPFLMEYPHCHFNLSHSDGVALIAVSSNYEVGVDIEVVSDRGNPGEIAMHHLSENELSHWSTLSDHVRHDAGYRLWTCKEACVKATGWGLNIPLPSIQVGFEPTQQTVNILCPDGTAANVEVLPLSTGFGSHGAVAWWRS